MGVHQLAVLFAVMIIMAEVITAKPYADAEEKQQVIASARKSSIEHMRDRRSLNHHMTKPIRGGMTVHRMRRNNSKCKPWAATVVYLMIQALIA